MYPDKLLAIISRQFLKDNHVNRYRTQKIADMNDGEVISGCHSYCEENRLTAEWNTYRERAESEYRYCSYLEQYIDDGFCYDLQMITGGFIKPSALSGTKIDKEKCAEQCSRCKHSL